MTPPWHVRDQAGGGRLALALAAASGVAPSKVDALLDALHVMGLLREPEPPTSPQVPTCTREIPPDRSHYLLTPQHPPAWQMTYGADPRTVRATSDPVVVEADYIAHEEWARERDLNAAWSAPHRAGAVGRVVVDAADRARIGLARTLVERDLVADRRAPLDWRGEVTDGPVAVSVLVRTHVKAWPRIPGVTTSPDPDPLDPRSPR